MHTTRSAEYLRGTLDSHNVNSKKAMGFLFCLKLHPVGGRVDQAVERLPSKLKTLSSNPNTIKFK
jgi:hypothetical protein